jgi:hypothetical protein
MFKIRPLIAAFVLFFVGDSRAADESKKAPPEEPKTLSVFPMGGQRGATVEVSVRGRHMQGAYAAWFECDDVEIRFLGLEEIQESAPDELVERDPQAKQTELAGHRARLQLRIGEDARVGLHRFRIVSPRGMSNALTFQVVSEPVVLEQEGEKHQAVQAPAVIAGTTKTNGEIDLYAFQAEAGEQFHFQTFTSFPIYIPYSAEAELNLYAPTGSWFDPDRLLRLPWESKPLSWVPVLQSRRQGWGARFAVFPMPTHRFRKAGRYLVSMGSFLGEGNPDFVYLLRIATEPPDSSTVLGQTAHPDPADWLERDSGAYAQHGAFHKPLESDRLKVLAARSVAPATGSGDAEAEPESQGDAVHDRVISRFQEQEPNDTEGPEVSTAVVLEGTIDPPGDVDTYRFRVKAGEGLAFEVETPKAAPPQFNPWIRVSGPRGEDVFANIHLEYGGDGDDVSKTTERKTVFTFQEDGIYQLRIRDLTSRRSGPDLAYRLMIRPKIPHVGRVEYVLGVKGRRLGPTTDRVNLEPGQSKTFTVICDLEEGFEGGVAVSADNLPSGVRVLPATPAPYTTSLLKGAYYFPMGLESGNLGDPTRFRPVRKAVTMALVADPDSPATGMPQLVRLWAQPMAGEQTGTPLPLGRVPIMVLATGQGAAASGGKKEYEQ